MSFELVNPATWGVGNKLTSAQINQLDLDHSRALDKTTAGDTISGVIVVDGTLTVGATGSIALPNTGQGISAEAGGTVVGSYYSAIESSVQGGIASTTDTGGFVLGPGTDATEGVGTTDWPLFPTNRTRTVIIPPALAYPGSGPDWAWNLNFMVASATDDVGYFLIPNPHNGATLAYVSTLFSVTNSHSSISGMTLPQMRVFRQPLAANSTAGQGGWEYLNTTSNYHSGSWATAAAYYNSGQTQSFTYTCNQNNVIDTTQYTYAIALVDENGTNAAAGNYYYGFELSYIDIEDMRFP